MHSILERLHADESGNLSQWITLVIFLVITILAFGIVWPWARDQINASTAAVGAEMNAMLGTMTGVGGN